MLDVMNVWNFSRLSDPFSVITNSLKSMETFTNEVGPEFHQQAQSPRSHNYHYE